LKLSFSAQLKLALTAHFHFLAGLLLAILLRFLFSVPLFLDSLAHFLGQLVVAFPAHRFAFEIENFGTQRFLTPVTHKALFVVIFGKSDEPVVPNGFGASVASVRKLREEMRFAIPPPFVFSECGGSYGFLACEAQKVFGMPHLPKSSDGTTDNGLFATAAKTLQKL